MILTVESEYRNGIQEIAWIVRMNGLHILAFEKREESERLAINLAKSLNMTPKSPWVWSDDLDAESAEPLSVIISGASQSDGQGKWVCLNQACGMYGQE